MLPGNVVCLEEEDKVGVKVRHDSLYVADEDLKMKGIVHTKM